MSSGIEYNYDFNYSLHLESGAFKLMTNGEEKDFTTSARQLCDYQLIKSKDIQQFYMLLIKQKPFIKLGKQIQELVQIQFELISKKNFKDMDQQYFLREQLCESIKQTNAMLGRERQYYTNVVILFLTVILLRVMYKKHEIQMQKSILFHFIHWQLKGQHSTNHFFESLLSDNVKVQLIARYEMRMPIHQQAMNQSLTFKQIQSSINLKRSISNSSFALAFNKQNQSLHQNFVPTFKAFKKVSANSNVQLQSLRPRTFQNCMNDK